MNADEIEKLDEGGLIYRVAIASGWTKPGIVHGEWCGTPPKGSYRFKGAMPDWTKRISVAWELIDEAINAGCLVSVNFEEDKNGVFVWRCRIRTWGGGLVFQNDGDKSAAFAICRAYLMWKTNEVK
jgi:hypothetical protein